MRERPNEIHELLSDCVSQVHRGLWPFMIAVNDFFYIFIIRGTFITGENS